MLLFPEKRRSLLPIIITIHNFDLELIEKEEIDMKHDK